MFLLNFVAGRWELEPWSDPNVKPGLVFIGEKVARLKPNIVAQIQECYSTH
jgi:hypothetical protein